MHDVSSKLPMEHSIVLAILDSGTDIWIEIIGFHDGKFYLPGRGATDFVKKWTYTEDLIKDNYARKR